MFGCWKWKAPRRYERAVCSLRPGLNIAASTRWAVNASRGAGIYYAAATVDPQLYEHSTVIVAGGGNSAGQAIMYLAQRAEKVLVVIRGEDLYKSMSSYLVRRIEQSPNVEVLRHTVVRRCEGVTCLAAVELEDIQAKSKSLIKTPALFSFLGALPR